MAADFEVEVTLDTNSSGFPEAKPHLPNQMGQRKTVHYFTRVPGATVRIDFVPNPNPPKPQAFLSPFVDSSGNVITTIRSTDPPRQLMKDGDFLCRCFLEFPRKNRDWMGAKYPRGRWQSRGEVTVNHPKQRKLVGSHVNRHERVSDLSPAE